MTTDAVLLGDAPELPAVVAFLRDIGLDVRARSLPSGRLLPAMTVRDGALLYDPAQPGWVGDLLHEAGHLAVTHPALRAGLSDVGDDPAEEMATIGWSYAAAVAIGLPIETLFHPAYKDGPEYLIDAFSNGSYIGLPMLHYWGMASRPDDGGPGFPAMRRWLRPDAART